MIYKLLETKKRDKNNGLLFDLIVVNSQGVVVRQKKSLTSQEAEGCIDETISLLDRVFDYYIYGDNYKVVDSTYDYLSTASRVPKEEFVNIEKFHANLKFT